MTLTLEEAIIDLEKSLIILFIKIMRDRRLWCDQQSRNQISDWVMNLNFSLTPKIL